MSPKVTDADLRHLKGLANLQTLILYNTTVSDAGLLHLKGLARLQKLALDYGTKVGDAGLLHLAGLADLQYLRLGRDPRIARRAQQLGSAWRAPQRLDDRVLTAAAPDHQHPERVRVVLPPASFSQRSGLRSSQ
jgi:hypothetical protein